MTSATFVNIVSGNYLSPNKTLHDMPCTAQLGGPF